MTFLCLQANVDDLPDEELKLFTLRTGIDKSTRLGFSIIKEGPLDDDQEQFWRKVGGIEEAETIVVNAILDKCERVGGFGRAMTRIAQVSRRGLGNFVLLNPLDKGKMPTNLNCQYMYTEVVPEGTGISIYKGNNEIDGAFFYSRGFSKAWLYFVPEWQKYAMLFDI